MLAASWFMVLREVLQEEAGKVTETGRKFANRYCRIVLRAPDGGGWKVLDGSRVNIEAGE